MSMTKHEFLERLTVTGTRQAQMCRDLDISPTTPLRWADPPGYAVAYLIALEVMDERSRLEMRHRIASGKVASASVR